MENDRDRARWSAKEEEEDYEDEMAGNPTLRQRKRLDACDVVASESLSVRVIRASRRTAQSPASHRTGTTLLQATFFAAIFTAVCHRVQSGREEEGGGDREIDPARDPSRRSSSDSRRVSRRVRSAWRGKRSGIGTRKARLVLQPRWI